MDQTEQLHGLMPLCATLGMRVLRMEPAGIEMEMDWTPERCTTNGLLHGGALMALADSAGGACAFTNLPEGATGTSTIESKTNFLGAVARRLDHHRCRDGGARRRRPPRNEDDADADRAQAPSICVSRLALSMA